LSVPAAYTKITGLPSRCSQVCWSEYFFRYARSDLMVAAEGFSYASSS